MDTLMKSFLEGIEESVGQAAMLLAMTKTLKAEDDLKKEYKKRGLRCVVSEIGGKSTQGFQERITKAVIGASLNKRLIEKSGHDIHALLHATEEAKRGILVNSASVTNIIAKIAIVRNDEWIAVAIFGESSIHPTTSHHRCGLGVMHI